MIERVKRGMTNQEAQRPGFGHLAFRVERLDRFAVVVAKKVYWQNGYLVLACPF